MSDLTHTIGSTGVVKKLVDLGDNTYADAVVDFNNGSIAEDAVVLAAPTGSAGGLGKLPATIANTEFFYVRCDTSARPYTYVDWIVSHAQQADLAFYKSQSIVDEVTLTMASFVDTNTVIINGLTYTGEETAADAAYASRKFLTAVGDTDDAAALAALINADYAVTTAGTSVAATDKLVITTDEGATTLVAAATADYPAGKYGLSATVGTELTSIVAAINHADNVTCATSVDGDTVTIVKDGTTYTFTSAAAEDTSAHEFDNDSSDNDTATSLAACINDATDGVDGITATASGAVVSITRDSQADTFTLASSDGTTLAVEAAGGVPGVVAAETGATGELSITPTWTETLTVTEAGTKLTVVDIDNPGILAAAALAVVTLTPGTPAGTDGELATVIYATAAANCTVSEAATLAGLMIDGNTAAVADEAATTGTAGTIEPAQGVDGYNYCYLKFTADNATPQAVSISAVKRI